MLHKITCRLTSAEILSTQVIALKKFILRILCITHLIKFETFATNQSPRLELRGSIKLTNGNYQVHDCYVFTRISHVDRCSQELRNALKK